MEGYNPELSPGLLSILETCGLDLDICTFVVACSTYDWGTAIFDLIRTTCIFARCFLDLFFLNMWIIFLYAAVCQYDVRYDLVGCSNVYGRKGLEVFFVRDAQGSGAVYPRTSTAGIETLKLLRVMKRATAKQWEECNRSQGGYGRMKDEASRVRQKKRIATSQKEAKENADDRI